LEKIWIDGTIKHLPWKEFVDRLEKEWENFTFLATVLLNANVAFLTIPAVSPQAALQEAVWTPAQITSQVSIIASMGSVIVGLLLIRQHRTRAKTAHEAATYLEKRTHHRWGLETLAIMYSLPYALLMWGMMTFLLAVAFICFMVDDVFQPCIYSVAWAFVVTLILWTIRTGWETKNGVKFNLDWRRVLRVFQRTFKDEGEAKDKDDIAFSDTASRVSKSAGSPFKRRLLRKFRLLPKRRHTEPSVKLDTISLSDKLSF